MVSSAGHSSRGTRQRRYAGLPVSGLGNIAPSSAQSAWILPLEKPQRPDMRTPPSMRSPRPLGATPEQTRPELALAPDFLLRTFAEHRHVDCVHAEDGGDPGLRTIGATQNHQRFVESLPIRLAAAEASGNHRMEDAGLDKVVDRLARYGAISFAVGRSGAQAWRQGACTVDNILIHGIFLLTSPVS